MEESSLMQTVQQFQEPLMLFLRWAHVLAAITAMGGLIFSRFALLPALEDLDEQTRKGIHDRIRRRWLPWVIGAITILLLSGLANYVLFIGRVKGEQWAGGSWFRYQGYHALMGFKILLAMGVFYLASALVGRGEGTQWARNDRAKWLTLTLGLALAVVIISGYLRQMHTGSNTPPATDSGEPMGSDAGAGMQRGGGGMDDDFGGGGGGLGGFGGGGFGGGRRGRPTEGSGPPAGEAAGNEAPATSTPDDAGPAAAAPDEASPEASAGDDGGTEPAVSPAAGN
ncbi:MAG: hypothetical protein DWH79_10630 [Planctomycetota bacterium]|nr:MAG: hypothetical protein DWH79_10630 [Planctomycetota bacterium]